MCRTNLPVARFIRTSPMFNWANIIKNFENAFKKTFSMDRKAHFDNLPEELSTVDGAKAHWCILLLLDAMIYILKNDGFTHSTRRAFNQHQVLYDCIFQELKTMDEKSFDLLSTEKKALVNPAEYNKEVSGKYSNLSLILQDAAWQSMEALEAQLVSECPASKAKNKFPIIVRLLTQNEVFSQYGANLHAILQSVTSKALFQFNPDKPILKKSEKVSKTKPSIMDALHEYRNARRENLLLLLSQRMTPVPGACDVTAPAPQRKQKRFASMSAATDNTQECQMEPNKHVRASSPPRNTGYQNTASLPASEIDPADFAVFDGEEFNFDDDLFGACGAAPEERKVVMPQPIAVEQKFTYEDPSFHRSPSTNDFFSAYMAGLEQKPEIEIKQEKGEQHTTSSATSSSCPSPLHQQSDCTSGESMNGDCSNSNSDSSINGDGFDCDSLLDSDDFQEFDSADLYEWLSPLMNEQPQSAPVLNI